MKSIGLKNKNNGFTLIEIIIVIVILGILAAIALPKLTENIDKARAAEAFNIGSSFAQALDRCLASQSGGNTVASGDANFTACLPGTFAADVAAMGMSAPPATNFTYATTTAAGINPVIFTATGAFGGAVAADVITFTINGVNGTVARTCGGKFANMCK